MSAMPATCRFLLGSAATGGEHEPCTNHNRPPTTVDANCATDGKATRSRATVSRKHFHQRATVSCFFLPVIHIRYVRYSDVLVFKI